MFTRVLMKYLESKDAEMHRRAKNVIKVCAERNKQGDPKYASLTSSMRTQLRQVVGDNGVTCECRGALYECRGRPI